MPIKICIRPLEDPSFEVDINDETTVAELKGLIHETVGIPSYRQKLVFKTNLLKDEEQLLREIDVAGERMKEGDSITLLVLARTIKVSGKLCQALQNDPDITLDVEPSDTIAIVKTKIQALKGISSKDQHLYANSKCLQDDSTIAECIPEGCPVLLAPIPVDPWEGEVLVKNMTGRNIYVNVESFDTVHHLKQKIQDKEGYHPSEQRLIIAPGQELLQEERTLNELGIVSSTQVHLILKRCLPWNNT